VAPAGNNHAYSGRYNRRLVFDLLRSNTELSRSELVDLTGLQPQTIANITRDLLERGLLSEEGRSTGGRGAPQKYLRLDALAGCTFGYHLDRDALTGVACDLLAREIARETLPVIWRNPESAIETIVEMGRKLASRTAGVPAWGIGVAMPTSQEADYEEYVGSPGWQEWSQLPMADVIEARCDLPVIVENDATASAIAELHAGTAASLSHYVYIYVGHGLGAGIIVDGLPFQGAFNNAGEIGLLSWPSELQSANSNGATPFSIEELACALGREQQDIEAFGVLDGLYQERNGILMAWLELNSRRLRLLVSMIENMFDPQTILVGGRLPAALCASLVDRSYPLLPSVSARKQRQRPRLQVAELGPDAPAIGAALLPVIAHGSPSFRRLSLMRGRSSIVDLEARFDRVAGAMN
jgi:predicted NBD/HSP70 family sugar kinase